MKVFLLVTERDGAITKEPGSVRTEIERVERLYAAREFRDVWEFVQPFEEYGETIISIAEVAPAIQVL